MNIISNKNHNGSMLLPLALKLNFGFSMACGLAAVIFFRQLTEIMGDNALSTGISLIIFALFILFIITKKTLNLMLAKVVIILDFLWVIMTCANIFIIDTSLTNTGNWIMGIAADIVLVLAILQTIGLIKYRKQVFIPSE